MARVNRATVLIVDDNFLWCERIAQILAPQYEIAGFVLRGDELLKRAITLQPDIITLDISMPGRGGLQLLPDLRVQLPDAVIVIVTTTSTKLYIDEAYRRGAHGYVDKRKALEDLIPAIENGSSERSSQREARRII